MGGCKVDHRSVSIERYHPDSDKWILEEDLPTNSSYTIIGDKLMLRERKLVEEYKPMTNPCKVKASLMGSVGIDASTDVHHIFTYFGKLLVTEFIEK